MFEALMVTLFSDDMLKIFTAAAFGTAFGLERELSGKDPSVRTFALIALGSCLFSMASIEASGQGTHGDAGRVAAQVVTGIGFIGAGVIFRAKQRVRGLTTAALIWVNAAIGMLVGLGRVDLAFSGTVVGMGAIVFLRFVAPALDRLLKRRLREPTSTRAERME